MMQSQRQPDFNPALEVFNVETHLTPTFLISLSPLLHRARMTASESRVVSLADSLVASACPGGPLPLSGCQNKVALIMLPSTTVLYGAVALQTHCCSSHRLETHSGNILRWRPIRKNEHRSDTRLLDSFSSAFLSFVSTAKFVRSLPRFA